MGRSRNIKPGFFTNEDLAECSPYARLLYIGLWTLADREGRLEDRPKKIKAEIFPFDSVDGDTLLSELANKRFILRYSIGDNFFIQILKFTKHQSPHHKESASVIPPPQSTCASMTQARLKHESSMTQARLKHESSMTQACVKHDSSMVPLDPLIPDSLNLIPDSPFPQTDSGGCSKVEPGGGKPLSSESIATLAMTHEGDFNEFFAAYAKKSARGAARAAYFAALRKAAPKDLLEAAKEYSRAYAGCVSEMKAPAAWLDGECWCDDRENWRPLSRGRPPTNQQQRKLPEPML